jgi:hypothetical protein
LYRSSANRHSVFVSQQDWSIAGLVNPAFSKPSTWIT